MKNNKDVCIDYPDGQPVAESKKSISEHLSDGYDMVYLSLRTDNLDILVVVTGDQAEGGICLYVKMSDDKKHGMKSPY
ncbi:MAG: hypothetical protein LBH00_10600 [Planctomycetaceae bacterium]|jgi:hypothetical protein|nr:hypothetical protein [Planctomycetaceae bacterium]